MARSVEKQQRGELDCRQQPFTLPPLTVHLQGNTFIILCMCAWKIASLSLPWNEMSVELIFLCQHWQGKRFMNMVIRHLPSSRPRMSTLHTGTDSAPQRQPWMIWYGCLPTRKLLRPSKRHRFPWRSNTQWQFRTKSRCEICETELGFFHLHQSHRRDLEQV